MKSFTSLLDVLALAASESPDQVIVHVAADGSDHPHTHRELFDDALRVAGGLSAVGLAPGTPVIVLPTGGADFLASFWGALAAGLVPVPMAAVPTKVHAVWSHLDHPPIIVDAMVNEVVQPLLAAAIENESPHLSSAAPLCLLHVAALRSSPPLATPHTPAPDDLALLQFSSGSTGAPKGVELTHTNVLINIEQARATGAVTPGDVIVSWLPYFHDMGLIGAHLTPLSAQIKQVKLDPVDFGKRPALWYETAQRHRGTLLPMAAFALAVTIQRVPGEQVAALDLTRVRLVGVGAEPISVRMWRDFIEHMSPSGLDPMAMAPLYGLAEATVAVAFPPSHELARPLRLDRRALTEGRAVDVDAGIDVDPSRALPTAPESDLGPAEFMDLGFAVTGGELRIVNDAGDLMADSMVGEIQFRGPNVARGYHRRPQETHRTFVDGWLCTGDLGFMRSGRLCITGRAKDVVFINGQKFHAHDLEQIVASTPGAPSGRVAVVGSTNPSTGTEQVAVFVSQGKTSASALAPVLLAIRARVREALAHPDVVVHLIPAADFPRTTSGKIQRSRLRELLDAGTFTAVVEPVKVPRSRSEIQTIITDVWALVLEVPADTIGAHDRFLSIGGSSLTAMQVLGELERAFTVRLSPAVLSRCATVTELTDHFLGIPAVDRVLAATATDVTGPTPARPSPDPAAIIGLTCRFPDADTPDAFWHNLLDALDSVTDVPPARWKASADSRPRWGAFLDDVARFDADFFGISAPDAAVMDPHARIFLEVAHEALERAGYAGERRTGRRVGVFVAIGESHYPELLREAMTRGFAPSPAALTGNLRNLVAARISHHLDLTGPAIVVDTACSSALVALHLARRSLESGECDLAVVGGVHLNLTDTAYTLLEAAQALSPTGRCHTFSADADGFVPGEGAAAVVLEPLTTAHSCGDPVLAIVRGSAMNNDGRSLSLMAPNPLLQEAVITTAYADVQVDPATVSYIEAHGTGTAVGDPIEARSLMLTFPATAAPRWLGSVKTNVGHLLNTAGMPSLLKVVLQLQHRRLAPSLHYGHRSPHFDLASAGLTVVTEPQPWDGPHPLRAGINGFGFGGTNAHVILEEAPPLPTPHDDRASGAHLGLHLLTLSAATQGALRTAATELATYVRDHPELDEGDVCRSASTAREHTQHRLALVVTGDLDSALQAAATETSVGVLARQRPRVVFVFPRHDATQPDLAERSLRLVEELRAWGIEPDAVIRHGVGDASATSALTTHFGPQVQRLLDDGYDTFVEIGPTSELTRLIRSNTPEGSNTVALAILGDAADQPTAFLHSVGQLWARGVRITRPDAASTRPRVPVPTYPFARTHHWLPALAPTPSTNPATPGTSLLHCFGWDESPLPAGTPLRSVCIVGVVGGEPDDTDHSLIAALTQRLVRRGVEVHLAPDGNLLDRPPTSVAILLSRSADGDETASLAGVAPACLATALQVCRQLSERPTALIVVTSDVAVTGTAVERPRPGQAVIAGLLTALPQENPGQGVRTVDLSSLDDTAAHLEALTREVDARPQPGASEHVAWRKGRRLTLSPRLGDPLNAHRSPPLPTDGCYLITGGSGGLGAAIATALAQRGNPRIVLVGRSIVPPAALLGELALLGATAGYVAADVSVAADVDRLVADLPPLDGLFHAAGVATLGGLRSVSVEDVESVLAPKVTGTVALARALDRYGRRPKTFVLFSSIASVLPGYAGGLGSYAAANAFLDAFAASETAAGRPVQSLNLAAVTDTGMARNALFALGAAANETPQLTRSQAVAATLEATTVSESRLLAMDASRSLPSTMPAAEPPSLVQARSLSEPQALTPAPRTNTDESVRDLLARLIGPEIGRLPHEIDDEASLLTMGLDSLTAVDLVKTLEAELGTSLPTTLLFEHPSIAELSAYLAAHAPDAAFALSSVQTAFHTLGQLHPDVAAYASVRLTIEGDLDVDRLARSLAHLDERHPMLRMRINGTGASAHQVIEPATATSWPVWFEVRDLIEPLSNAEEALANDRFSLDTQAPIRATLLREHRRSHLVVVLHHAGGDGSSLNLLCEEMWHVYTALSHGRPPELAALTSHFRDHVREEAAARHSASWADDADYWKQRLHSVPSAPLPTDAGRTDASRTLKALQRTTTATLTAALHRRAAELDVSLFHLVLSAWARRVSIWSGHATVTVNVARAGRDARLPDIFGIVGSFADTLPLTVTVANGEDPSALPLVVRRAWLDTMKHASVTSLALARLLPAHDASPRTVGGASFSFSRFPVMAPADCPVQVTATSARTASPATRVGLLCWEFGGALQFSWNYPANLFADSTVEAVADAFMTDLTSLAQTTASPGAAPDSIARRIHRQSLSTPEAVAVQHGDDETTYAELDRSARNLATRLRAVGVAPQDRVALLTAPGPTSVIGLLGIVYAGATWVPLDARHPVARLADQAQRCRTTAVVIDQATGSLADRLDAGCLVDAESAADITDLAEVSTDLGVAAPTDDAYIIFTSGTTGRPKAIPITHDAITIYLDWAIATFGYAEGDRMAATASLCFDASVRQVLAPLLVGATVVVIAGDTLLDPVALLGEVEARGVTVWSSVPTLWGELLRAAERRHTSTGVRPDLSALRWIHTGGEALSPAQVRRWFDLFGSGHRIANLYGPTEATINATFEVIDTRPDDAVTAIAIGRPVAQTEVEVVAPDGATCAPGDVGELWIAGPSLSAGYLDDPALSAQAFVERAGRRFYRSGDRARWRADGKLEFLGRLDAQVNLAGHRIEPAEIEATLRTHEGVERAAVVVESAAAGAPRLVAYVQPRSSSLTPSEVTPTGLVEGLREHLAQRLPAYMVPTQIRLLQTMPVTPVGKVDPAQLSTSALHVASAPVRVGLPLTTPTEVAIAHIWSDLLGVKHVFADDDFFALGGDSMAVLEVFARLEPDYEGLPAPTALYRHRILSDLATVVDGLGLDVSEVSQAPTTHALAYAEASFPLTPAQRGFVLAEALSPLAQSSWVNCLRIAGPLDLIVFQAAVDTLVARHPMLRMQLSADQRPPTQHEVAAPATIEVHCETIAPEHLGERVDRERAYRFDLSGWPLVRLRLFRLAEHEWALVVHGHHAIADGYSVALLIQELITLCEGLASGHPAAVPPPRSTFRDYAALTASYRELPGTSSSPTDPGLSTYVAPLLRAAASVARDETCDEPGASSPPHLRVAVAATSTFTLDARTAASLTRCAAQAGVTPYAPFLTAYYRALRETTHQYDLVLGVATAGRDYALPDVSRIVGPCAYLLPVRVADSSASFAENLVHLGESVATAREDGASMQIAAPTAAGPGTAPAPGAQFVFSYLAFGSLRHIETATLQVTWDRDVGYFEPPPIGTDLFFTARPVGDEVHCTLRASAAAMTATECDAFARMIEIDLLAAAKASGGLDAAIIGYLPAPTDLLKAIGSMPSGASRELIRSRIFPDGQPRLLEEVATPLGVSGFVALPIFADELAGRDPAVLCRDVAHAVEFATTQGARCVSLAGMIPSHTAYGLGVVRHLSATMAPVSTGHAATAVSVVKTVIAALDQTGRDLTASTVAFVGIGSIGRSALELLMAKAGSPSSLILCDVVSREAQVAALAAELAADSYAGDIRVACSASSVNAAVYDADLIVAAISGGQQDLDIDRVRPGTVVVDDSFPQCFDPQAARERMARRGDVLVLGGGLMDCGPINRTVPDGILTPAQMAAVMNHRLPDAIASCQLESLVQARSPQCPVVHGLVSPTLASTYWDALNLANVRAAPLHLVHDEIPTAYLATFRRTWGQSNR